MKVGAPGGFASWLTVAIAWMPLTGHCQSAVAPTAVAVQQQQPADAAAEWKHLTRIQPGNPLPYAQLGLLEAKQGNYPEAIAYYRRAMALNPALPGLRLNLGLALFKSGKFGPAIECFKPLLAQGAQDADERQRVEVLLGMSYYGLGQYASAAPFLSAASARDPQNLPLLLSLAHSCLLSKQYDCVLDAFHKMVALNANSAEAEMLVGEALDEMKDSTGAIREFRAAVAANPKEPNVHFGLGYLLWTQKQYQEAAEEFQAELANTPDYTQAQVYLADSYLQLNLFDKATPLLKAIVASNKSIEMAQLDLGIVDSEAGRNEDALRELKAAEALKAGDINVHWRLGRLYRSMGRTAESKVEFDKARALNKAADDALLDVINSTPQNNKSTFHGNQER